MWYWLADTLLWQLSIGYTMDVQYEAADSHTKLPHELDRVRFNIGFLVIWTVGRAYLDLHNFAWCKYGAKKSAIEEKI